MQKCADLSAAGTLYMEFYALLRVMHHLLDTGNDAGLYRSSPVGSLSERSVWETRKISLSLRGHQRWPAQTPRHIQIAASCRGKTRPRTARTGRTSSFSIFGLSSVNICMYVLLYTSKRLGPVGPAAAFLCVFMRRNPAGFAV